MREVPLYAGTCIHPLPASASNAVQHPPSSETIHGVGIARHRVFGAGDRSISLIRNSPPPRRHHRALGLVLL